MNIKVDIPKKLSTNDVYSGIHWAVRKKHKDLYHEWLMEFRGMKVKEYPVEITYVFNWKSKPLDTTNCGYIVKLLEDSLIANGIIEDDSPKYVAGTHIYSQKGDKDWVDITII